jgi:TPR repeat protein
MRKNNVRRPALRVGTVGVAAILAVAVVCGVALAGCGSSPKAAPAAKADYSSSWLAGKWLSLSSEFVEELVLLKDGTGTHTLYKGSGQPEMAFKLTFDPNVDFFSLDPMPGSGKTIPAKYARSEDGTGFTADFPGAEGSVFVREEQLIKEVSDGEDTIAILRLGNYYSVAGNEKCIALFTDAANRGVPDGNLNLGNHYYNTDKAKAFEYYMKAAEQGNPRAEYNVAVFYGQGLGGVPKDNDKFAEWLIKAAEHGSPDAINILKQLGMIK